METAASNASYEYAGFWIRLAATIIDALLLMIVTFPILIAIYGREYFDNTNVIVGSADIVISWVFPVVATLLFWLKKQATPGKLLLSLKIIDATTGRAPHPTQYMVRYLAYFLSAMMLLLGFLWIGVDRRKQGLHDKLAGTVVVRKLPVAVQTS